ncbi:MAG TPA: hypothetical protein VIV11_16995 [Kofleriaceae bacterium]
MRKWIALGIVIVASAIVVAVMLTRSREAPATRTTDTVVEDFRAVERTAIAAFNAALGQQRANQIDEIELALAIERDVLEPWRAMRARVTTAPVPPERRELYEVMRRYIDERVSAWQAYADALRAPSDTEARPLYDVYHQKNAAAQDDARVLGGLFRRQL